MKMDRDRQAAAKEAGRFRAGLRHGVGYLRGFFLWVLAGLLLGLAGGLVGSAFSLCVRLATGLRLQHPWLIWLLPLGGLGIALLYHIRALQPTDTNGILLAIHSPARIPLMTGPVIFVSSVLSHLLGASVGREGAALQIGGVLGYHLARLFRQGEKDTHLIVMCGMSAVFSALFGAPLTAAVFAIEVASVGILHFSAIVPCLTAALTATWVAGVLGVPGEYFPLPAISFSLENIGAVALISLAGAGMSILFCLSLRQGHRLTARLLPNRFWRIAAGGLLLAILTQLVGTMDYNGAGMDVVAASLQGHARPAAFLWKLVFTVISVSCGFKGGEIVPSMFIGATMGCLLSGFLSIDPGVGAAVGLLSMFCGCLNCPISSVFLGLEMFGGANIRFFAVACAISYMLSANYGLYEEQKIVYSKLHPEFIDRYTS